MPPRSWPAWGAGRGDAATMMIEQEIDMTAKTAKKDLYGMTGVVSTRNRDETRGLQSQGWRQRPLRPLQCCIVAYLVRFPSPLSSSSSHHTSDSGSHISFRRLLTAYTNMSTTPAPPIRPPTAAPARSTTPGSTPAHPPPSTTGAQQSNMPSNVPRAIPAGVTPINLAAPERHTSQAPSEGSHVPEHGALALVHQPSTAYRMNMGVEQVKEGSEIRVIKQVQQAQYRGVVMGAGQGAAGQKEVVHEVSPPYIRKEGRKEGRKKGKKDMGIIRALQVAEVLSVAEVIGYTGTEADQQMQQERRTVIPSSQSEPEDDEHDTAAEIVAKDGDEEATEAGDYQQYLPPSARLHSAKQTQRTDAPYDSHYHPEDNYAHDGRFDAGEAADYDDMGEGVGGYADDAAYDGDMQDMIKGYGPGADEAEQEQDELDDEPTEAELQFYHQQAQGHAEQSRTHTPQGYPQQPSHPHMQPQHAQHPQPPHQANRVATDKARGQYRPPGPAHTPGPALMANTGFIAPSRTGPPPTMKAVRPHTGQGGNINHGLQPGMNSSRDAFEAQGRPRLDSEEAHQDTHVHQRARARADAHTQAHVHTENVGGRSRLVKRVGSKRDFDDFVGGASQDDEQEQATIEFDPTDEVSRRLHFSPSRNSTVSLMKLTQQLKLFDYETELVKTWEDIQKDVPVAVQGKLSSSHLCTAETAG